jgi:hypothetical protein
MRQGFAAPAMTAPALLPAEFAPSVVVETFRWADRGLIFADNTFYEARLLGEIQISQSAMDKLAFGDRVALTASQASLWNGDRALDTVAAQNTAAGRKAVLKTSAAPSPSASDAGAGALSGASIVFTGVVSAFGAPGRTIDLSLGDFSDRLNVPLQPNLYDGSGGLGGTTDLKGLPKPVSLGWRYNVTPVYLGLIDFGDGPQQTYQTHWRQIQSHDAMRERGVPMTKTTAAPGVGEFRDWPQFGCFQLGFTADGIVTCDVAGDNAGSYAGITTDVIQRLLTSLGPGFLTSDIDAASFSRVATRLPGEMGWGCGAEIVQASDAVEQILQHCGAIMSGNRQGLARIAIAAPQWQSVQLALEGYGDVASLMPVALPSDFLPTPQSVTVTGKKNWTPLTDIAGSVSDTDRAALAAAGSQQVGFSNAVAARLAIANQLSLPGLYRFESDALARAQIISDWLATGLRAFQITTDRYLNQIEIGHMATVTYPLYGLDAGFTGVVAEWTEQPALGRVTFTIVG